MKEFKGTKGKWEYSKSNTGSYIIIVDNNYIGSFRKENDAKLIASAPEMFEILNKVNDFIIKNKNKNYMIELLNREIPEIKQLLTKITE